MPTVASLQASIDATLATLDTAFVTNQATYRGIRPKPFQGILTTPLASLADQTDISVIAVSIPTLTSKPTDQAEDWTAFTTAIVGSLNCAIEIHNYGKNDPSTHGWVLHAYFKHTGRIFRRSINHGPETYRETPWGQVGALGV